MSDRMARVVVGVLGFRATGVLRWIATVAVVAVLGGVGLERWKAWELAGEGRALETRAFELLTRAMAPGSALACLDAVASSAFREGCEKALFATPESTAAAVSYVAAQLTLLAAGREHARRAEVVDGASLAQLRSNAEQDAFGIVAHVLAAREGCTADNCRALAILTNAQRVRANLAQRTFDANVSRYAAAWVGAGRAEVARLAEPGVAPEAAAAPVQTTPAPAVTPPPRKPNNYFFPSADSIPAVSIMSAEPPDAPAERSKTASAEAARKSPARGAPGVNSAAAGNQTAPMTQGPMPLAPPRQ